MGTALLVDPNASDFDLDVAVAQFRPLADWWSNKIQWCEDDHEDLVQEGMLSLITTIKGYQKSGKQIQDLKSLASICFSAAMKWWYKKSDRTLNYTGLEHISIPVDNIEMHFSQIFVDEYLAELERVHGAIARQIVENLLDPSEAVTKLALETMEEKKILKAAGAKVIGYASPRVQKQHIRQVVGLDVPGWDRLMADIRDFTTAFVKISREQGAPCHSRENATGHLKKEYSVQQRS